MTPSLMPSSFYPAHSFCSVWHTGIRAQTRAAIRDLRFLAFLSACVCHSHAYFHRQVLGSFIFLNIIVAVILENFTLASSANPDLVTANDLEVFKETWEMFDPDANQTIPSTDLPKLLLVVPPPLGVRGKQATDGAQPGRQALRMAMALDLAQHDGVVLYQEVLSALVHYNFRANAVEVDNASFRRKAAKLAGGRVTPRASAAGDEAAQAKVSSLAEMLAGSTITSAAKLHSSRMHINSVGRSPPSTDPKIERCAPSHAVSAATGPSLAKRSCGLISGLRSATRSRLGSTPRSKRAETPNQEAPHK